ncbi:DNA-directed DNA/RNA polymerase mu [Mycena venus]|uniref:DNA polymerase n=1 Tax=Mycena venus TaxID=2733690 RepID=A0A8H6YJF5_9AGAR|nr:DNA-directed DNA/RNA polymerase mu [Mycena venus]
MSNDNSSSESLSSPSLTPIPTSGLVKLYLVQAKLNAQDISELLSLAERHNLRVSKSRNGEDSTKLQLCTSPEDCDIIITAVRMRKRLERHVDWNLAKAKAIVTPDWLRDSVQQRTILPCGDYAALRELKQNTIQHCPDSDEDTDREGGGSCVANNSLARTESEQLAEPAKAHYTSRYACLRPCPMVCPNQGLVQQLGVIRRSRELEGKDTSALSYERAISIIKAYPHTITSWRLTEVSNLSGIGEKMLSKITEYVTHGKIRESRSSPPPHGYSLFLFNLFFHPETIAASARFKSLSEFTTIYGIGATTARKLFDSFGLRTLDDLKEHYASHDPPPHPYWHNRNHSEERRIMTPAPVLSIMAALDLRDDLNEKIPRAEVDLMHDIVMGELGKLRPGCLSTVVGGYRRGKTESNDVDIVITHPTLVSGSDQVKGLGEVLVNRLYEAGLITHVMHLSGFHTPDALRTSHWDTLEKALTVFILPPDALGVGSPRIHRRLDLIFAAPEAYWTAITGWTGSKHFERDLRLWAKVERGMKFDSSGITRRRDSKQYFPRSEQEVFDILGLEWIDPTMRNADL